MANFEETLSSHGALSRRREESNRKLQALRDRFNEHNDRFATNKVSVFCAGSIGRGEVGLHSDLDLFLVSLDETPFLAQTEILGDVIRANDDLGYPRISGDGKFLKLHRLDMMLEALGSPNDDSQNLFTTRMVMLLESRAACNDPVYDEFLNTVASHYFRDRRGKTSFRPLFLLNDILRYWRTLCLNYELIRDKPDLPWRKKNINLKFSRMITVFGTVLPLISVPITSEEDLRPLLRMNPLSRIAFGLDSLGADELLPAFTQFLDNYEKFLSWKDKMDPVSGESGFSDEEVRLAASQFSDYIYGALRNQNISPELQKYLLI